MADYKKMYAILCRAVDAVIEPLEQIPLALPAVQKLQSALWEAEEVYIDTEAYLEEQADSKRIAIKIDVPTEE